MSKGTCTWPVYHGFLIEPHEDYLRLAAEPAMRQAVYRDLFRVHIDPELLKGLRQATQTNRVFGADYFQK